MEIDTRDADFMIALVSGSTTAAVPTKVRPEVGDDDDVQPEIVCHGDVHNDDSGPPHTDNHIDTGPDPHDDGHIDN
jgi:hypothetical protein